VDWAILMALKGKQPVSSKPEIKRKVNKEGQETGDLSPRRDVEAKVASKKAKETHFQDSANQSFKELLEQSSLCIPFQTHNHRKTTSTKGNKKRR
jgi:hypothetical protein